MNRLAWIISAGLHTTLIVGLSYVTLMTIEPEPESVHEDVAIDWRVPRPVFTPPGGPTRETPPRVEPEPLEIQIEYASVDVPEVAVRIPELLVEPIFVNEGTESVEDSELEDATSLEEKIEVAEEVPAPPKEEVVEIRAKETEAELQSEIRPVYPKRCRRRGHEGVVELRIFVDAAGAVERVEVIQKSECRHLDEAAVETARQLKYGPATRAGVAVSSESTLRIRFELE